MHPFHHALLAMTRAPTPISWKWSRRRISPGRSPIPLPLESWHPRMSSHMNTDDSFPTGRLETIRLGTLSAKDGMR